MVDRPTYPPQTSPVTCGIASLAAVAGRLKFPHYLDASPTGVAAVQERLHRIASRTGVPWPRFLGTSPWALAALASSLTGRRYQIVFMLKRPNRALDALAQAVEMSADCFLYVGGNAKFWQFWIPRHVVAVLGEESTAHRLRIFEPSSGRIFDMPWEGLAEISEPRPEFGHWLAPLLAVVPCGSRG